MLGGVYQSIFGIKEDLILMSYTTWNPFLHLLSSLRVIYIFINISQVM